MENKSFKIRGVNLGGWLMMEGYILHGRNIAESVFKKSFKKSNGLNALKDFEKSFRDTFITEKDFKNIAVIGANTIRLPFNHKLIETKPYYFDKKGLNYLDNSFRWAEKYGLKIILDLHAAPGAQNCDWHGDCEGKAFFWEDKKCRQRAIVLWEFLADRYKNEKSLLGYDLLNEPVLNIKKEKILKTFYKDAIKKIKSVDKKNIIFLEGSVWAQKIDFLKDLIEENITISIHYYHPLSYTYNYNHFSSFPGKIDGESWDEKRIEKALKPYYEFSKENKVDIFVGEFGINWRGGYFGESEYLRSVLKVFEKYGFGHAYWTYKAVSNNTFPDGIYQHLPNNNFVKREGPVYGWENYIPSWKSNKKNIVNLWDTKNYTQNKEITNALRKYC
ncbi:MAG: cellulase family glycosylhydrolase [Elusimicrobia bacterium]|nr:cellulase family glycosylhydrolase [Elusimicrobiota bacterium]